MVINVDDKNGLSIADGAPTMIFTSLKINNVGGTLFVSFPNGLYQPSRDLLEKIFICGFNRTQNQAIELSFVAEATCESGQKIRPWYNYEV